MLAGLGLGKEAACWDSPWWFCLGTLRRALLGHHSWSPPLCRTSVLFQRNPLLRGCDAQGVLAGAASFLLPSGTSAPGVGLFLMRPVALVPERPGIWGIITRGWGVAAKRLLSPSWLSYLGGKSCLSLQIAVRRAWAEGGGAVSRPPSPTLGSLRELSGGPRGHQHSR